MNKQLAQVGMDLFTIIAFIFILLTLVLYSMAQTEKVMAEFNYSKTEQTQKKSVPDSEEMANVYFYTDTAGKPIIEFVGQNDDSNHFVDVRALLIAIEEQAPKYLRVNVEADYKYDQVGALLMAAPQLNIKLYMVADYAK